MTLITPPAASVVFPSETALRQALSPLSPEEVSTNAQKAASPFALQFEIDETLSKWNVTPLRNPGTGDLLKTPLYQTKTLTVFYPENPRVPHHLSIALNRESTQGISSVTEEENQAIFATIQKIAEIYKTIQIRGFVIAQYDTPQTGHWNRYVVEIIPHLPGFHDVKNITDKIDCNRYVLFRNANLSPLVYPSTAEEVQKQAAFWQTEFQKTQDPLTKSDTELPLPYTRKESHQREAEKVLYRHLIELLQDKGGQIDTEPPFEALMPTEMSDTVKSITVEKCAFCNPDVIDRQLVYQYGSVSVFYNMRKGVGPTRCFLILPHHHTEKVYDLSPEEIRDTAIVRKALVEVLKETHPESEVIVYTQDDPAIGQTVFHSHEQVVAVNPKTIALEWTLMSLYSSGNVSNEEMLKVREEFGKKIEEKIKHMVSLEEAS